MYPRVPDFGSEAAAYEEPFKFHAIVESQELSFCQGMFENIPEPLRIYVRHQLEGLRVHAEGIWEL